MDILLSPCCRSGTDAHTVAVSMSERTEALNEHKEASQQSLSEREPEEAREKSG